MATGEAPARQNTIRFGDFELDLARQTLSRRGIRLKLQNQPCHVLALLIQHAPAVVSRDEIRQHVWGDNVHIDTERSINFCIRQIRGVLLDNAASPRFIETLPREGYRFIAPLEGMVPPKTINLNSSPAVKEKEEVPIQNVRPKNHQWLVLSLALAGALTVAVIGVWLLRREVPVKVSNITPVTSYPGDEREPSFSPDGRQVAFSWNGEDANRHIYVKLLGEQRPLRLTNDSAEDSDPAWSPDGKQIAFLRRRTATESDIMLISSLGGPERTVHRIQVGYYVFTSGRMLAWSPDCKWLCFTSGHALFMLSLPSGNVRPLFHELAGTGGDTSPAFSSDGRWLAFARFASPSTSKIAFQQLSEDCHPVGKTLLVRNTSGNSTNPVWLADNYHVLFLDYNGSRISQAPIGGTAKLIYIASAKLAGLTVDKPGEHLITSRLLDNDNIETLPLNGLKVAGAAQRLVYSSANESQPRFSPDGRLLAFKSDRSGASEIWLADADGENPRQLTHIGAYIAGYPKWSADSNFLVFHARLPDEGEIYTVRLQDGFTRQITHDVPGFADASFSHDGATVYMIRDPIRGSLLYRVPLSSLALQPLWHGCCALEAPGRGLLLYANFDHKGIFARSLSGDPTHNPETQLIDDYMPPLGRFAPVDDGIYYTACTSMGKPRAFRFYAFASRQSVDIAPTPPNYYGDISVSPDRTRLAYTTEAKGNQDLVQLDLN